MSKAHNQSSSPSADQSREKGTNGSAAATPAPPRPTLRVSDRATAPGADTAGASRGSFATALGIQRRAGQALAGAILVSNASGQPMVIARAPRGANENEGPWLKAIIPHLQRVQTLGPSVVVPLDGERGRLYGDRPGRHAVLMGIGEASRVIDAQTGAEGASASGRLVEAFLVEAEDARELNHRRQLLEVSRSLLDVQTAQAQAMHEARKSRQLAEVLDGLDAFQSEDRFRGAAMALCNELASRLGAERVSLGFVAGRYVKVAAMSHTEHLNRRMQLVQDIESTMEECVDQDVEVSFPEGPQAPFVNRAAAALSKKHGPSAVLTVPLRDRTGAPVAALTIERPTDGPLEAEQVRSVRLLCNLVTPRLLQLYADDRWFAARWVTAARHHAATLVGPEHTWVKLTAVGLVAALAAVLLIQGTDHVEGTFVVEPVVARSVPAPWDGYLEDVQVEPGDVVQADETVLGRLDTAELQMELAQVRADRQVALTEADVAWREGKQAERLVALAQADQAQAKMQLLEHRLNQSRIVAPLSGLVTQGDLRRELGRPVQQGEVLFEVAPLDALRAVMMVPEQRIFDVYVGQRGELATASHPGDKLPFVVEHIHPVAELVEQNNVFKVRIRLEPEDGRTAEQYWLKPDVTGVAKADAGKAPLAWLWTRDAINWVRMKLWW